MKFLLLFVAALVSLLVNPTGAVSEPIPLPAKVSRPRFVWVCLRKGISKRILLRRLSFFLKIGAKRGRCPKYAVICVNQRKTRRIRYKFLRRHLRRPNVVQGKCRCRPPFFKKCANGRRVRKDLKTCKFQPCGCPRDTRLCPNGTRVGRDPKRNCRFRPCPKPIICKKDTKKCEDGSFVTRVGPKCQFAPCPEPKQCCKLSERPSASGLCREGCGCCPDGAWAGSIGDGKTFACGGRLLSGNALGEVCDEGPIFCTADVKECPDGSFVPRSGPNCEFAPCPEPKQCCKLSERPVGGICFEGCGCCPDGTWAGSIGDGKTFACGGQLLSGDALGKVCDEEPVICTADVKECPDGSFASRDPKNDCKFEECPTPKKCCPSELFPLCLIGTAKCCGNGQWRCPNGLSDEDQCANIGIGKPCVPVKPRTCCDPADRPGANGGPICSDGSFCCPDGTWTCGNGDGSFTCNDEVLRGPQGGEECEPVGCPEDLRRCDDGTVLLRNPKNNCEFPKCPVTKPKCCDSSIQILCKSGVPKCCPNTGQWACPVGKSLRYQCGDRSFFTGFGKACPKFCRQRDIRRCEDGRIILRDPKLNCEFPPCPKPPKKCPGPNKLCPELTLLRPNPKNGCKLPECPSCCPLRGIAPFCPGGGREICCPQGNYQCPISSGLSVRGAAVSEPKYECGGDIITSGFGKICALNCCPGEPPRCKLGGAKCCPGKKAWACPDKNGHYVCDGEKTIIETQFGCMPPP